MSKLLSRRDFMRATALSAAGVAVVACQPKTVIVKETVEVEKEVEKVVKETVVVETEKEVTKVVEKEVIVTAIPEEIREAPETFALVAEGKLPPAAERIPTEPLVMNVVEEIGIYGGTWRRVAIGPGDVGIMSSRLSYDSPLRYTAMADEIIPHAARAFEVSDGGNEFTFFMRKGMKWSDGRPFTADDIMFWYTDHAGNAEISPTGIGGWLLLNGEPVVMEKVDDYTVKYTFATSYGLFVSQMASTTAVGWFARYPAEHLKQFHAGYADKAELDKAIADAGYDTWVNFYNAKRNWDQIDHPRVWPWLMVKVPPDVPCVAERNAYSFVVDPEGNQLPYIDRIRFEVVENINILNLKATAGAVDMQFRHLSWENFPLFIDSSVQGDYRVMKWMLAEGSNTCFHFNLNVEIPGLRELNENKKFRQALSIAIDRDEINQVAYQGLGTPRQASVLPGVIGWKQEQSDAYAQFDPDTANQWLDEIGLTARDAEGFRLDLRGETLTINIEYCPLFGPWGDVVQMVCQYWGAVGVRAFPKEESRPLYNERAVAGTLQEVHVWQMDRAAHWLLEPWYQLPRRQGTPGSVAALYDDWWQSKGANGEEPTPEVKRAFELNEACKTAKNDEELEALATEWLDHVAEQVWYIGVVGILPHVGIVKNSFRNVPEEAVSDWLCQTPGNCYIEQYFIKEV